MNLIPGDFNGDSVIDLMIIHGNQSNKYLSMRLLYGNKTSKNQNDICKYLENHVE